VTDGVTTNGDEMIARRRPLPRLGRGAQIIAVIALALLIALIVLWTQRKPIARGYVHRYLAGHNVLATYDIAELGLGHQRLTNVVIGDPARPDLVADWVELRTGLGFSGASVNAVRAGHVRLRGKLIDGKLSLGAIDRLMPASSGKPFSLPALDVDVADARMRLETPQGLVGLKLSGRGRLNDGFRGNLAAVSERLNFGGCFVERASAAMAIGVSKAAPSLQGPVRAGAVTCGNAKAMMLGANVAVAFGAGLERWKGDVQLATAAVSHPLVRTVSLAGSIGFVGTAVETLGHVKIDTGRFASAEGSGTRLGFGGDYRLGKGLEIAPDGYLDVANVVIAQARLEAIARLGEGAAGTPVGPLARALAKAGVAAGQSINGAVRFGWRSGGPVQVSRITASSRSGLNATLSNADIVYDPYASTLRIAGALVLGGGGFPSLKATLVQADAHAAVTGMVSLDRPYLAGGASLTFTPLRFSATPRGNSRFATRLTVSGPLGGGRVEGLDVPVQGIWNGRGQVVINPDCAAVGWQKLAVSGLSLRAASLKLCPTDGAMVAIDNGRLSGGASIAAPRLAGTLGTTPITMAASSARIGLHDLAFDLHGAAVRIGAADRVTRLDFATIEGKRGRGGLSGTFAGGGGQVGAVPLVLSAAEGTWGFNGDLGLTGAMTVSDAAPVARFKPLSARMVTLGLKKGVIGVAGVLYEPGKGARVADVAIRHELSSGKGSADLKVPGLAFADKGLQPDDLTPLTASVIQNVVGMVTGEGHIRWSPDGVTSDGVFRTANMDLAAALGPVTGITTEIRFTDLLNLQSAPGQVATIKAINTGIVVNDGVVRYQTLPNARVQVERGRWPFAGGDLVLEPTLLDFSDKQERHMTLTVTGMEAAKFLQQFDFENLAATGVFDGRLPMIFDSIGGRIEDGNLRARKGGGTVAYLGEVSKENLGVWGNLAFQALKSLRYRELDLVMNGPLSGEMITEAHFAGLAQGQGAKSNFLIRRLQRLPFVFNVKIKAPFRGLFDSARSFYDPRLLVERNLPALIEQRDKRARPPLVQPPLVQPKESETMP
jgi:translocation and assembly module TamB